MITYSFEECSFVLNHPSLGTLTLTGKGLGNIAIAMSGDRTSMEPASDGTILTSKIKDRRATATIQIQQTSDANRSLLRWYNYLENASASEWARATGNFKSQLEQAVMVGVAFQKLPDRGYGAQGGMQSWALMIADCQQNTL